MIASNQKADDVSGLPWWDGEAFISELPYVHMQNNSLERCHGLPMVTIPVNMDTDLRSFVITQLYIYIYIYIYIGIGIVRCGENTVLMILKDLLSLYLSMRFISPEHSVKYDFNKFRLLYN